MMTEAQSARVHNERGISPVWLVPIAALVVAVWLGVQAWRDRGVSIVIEFDSAAGIEVNKTRLRYKDVSVGLVKKVALNDQLDRVAVTVEILPALADQLSSNSRFWVVSPTVTASGISGLNTLISGVYIGLDPGEKGDSVDRYEGSLVPQSIASGEEGKRFRVRAETLGSLNVGSAIYYRQVPAGEVTGYELAADGRYVLLDLFVKAPYDAYVHAQSRFWNISGFGVEISDRGVRAQVGSLASVMTGGIAFDTPEDVREPKAADEAQVFLLYPNEAAVKDGVFSVRYYYQMHFSGSVRGLNVGAPVEFHGIPVGEVLSVKFDPASEDAVQIDVLVAFQPQRFYGADVPDYDAIHAKISNLVQQGMKGQLKVGSLLTGAAYIDLIMEPDTPGTVIEQPGGYPVLPTAEAPIEQISKQVSSLLDRASQFPLEEVGSDLKASAKSLRRVLADLEEAKLGDQLERITQGVEQGTLAIPATLVAAQRSLVQLSSTLETMEGAMASDSPLLYEMQQMVRQVRETADEFRRLGEELNRNPNALIFGKGSP